MSNCKKCRNEFEPSKGLVSYCSLKCRNSRSFSEDSKLKKSVSNLEYYNDNPRSKQLKESICIVCSSTFPYKWKKRTCSDVCKRYVLSMARSKYILENGTNNFNTKQEIFSYKFVNNILLDSKLEKAGIIYLIDEFKADSITRYNNILNYTENGYKKAFNPDFYVKKDNQVYIVEVKMKWSENSIHHYNRTIPLKKEALMEYCSRNEFNMIWLDFDYDLKFKQIYYSLKN